MEAEKRLVGAAVEAGERRYQELVVTLEEWKLRGEIEMVEKGKKRGGKITEVGEGEETDAMDTLNSGPVQMAVPDLRSKLTSKEVTLGKGGGPGTGNRDAITRGTH